MTLNSATSTLTSAEIIYETDTDGAITSATITEGDLAYKFTNSSGQVVAGFFTTGYGCQLAIKDPSDGTWHILNFSNLTTTTAQIAAAFSTYLSYLAWTTTTLTESSTLEQILSSCSTLKGSDTFYMYQANDTGDTGLSYHWYDSSGLTSGRPTGNAVSGVYLYSYIESGSTTIGSATVYSRYAVIHVYESGVWKYTLNLYYYLTGNSSDAELYSINSSSTITDYSSGTTYYLSSDTTVLGGNTLAELLSSPTTYGFSNLETAKKNVDTWEAVEL